MEIGVKETGSEFSVYRDREKRQKLRPLLDPDGLHPDAKKIPGVQPNPREQRLAEKELRCGKTKKFTARNNDCLGQEIKPAIPSCLCFPALAG